MKLRASRHVRTTISESWAAQFAHVAVDRRLTRQQALREAIFGYLERHGRAQGLSMDEIRPSSRRVGPRARPADKTQM
jgi:hypothetical protein